MFNQFGLFRWQTWINFLGFVFLYFVFTIFLIDYDTLGKSLHYFWDIRKGSVTPEIYGWISGLIYLCFILYVLLCFYLLRKKRINFYYLRQSYKTFGESYLDFVKCLLSLDKRQKMVLVFLFFGILFYRIFLIFNIALESDELKSLFFFIRFSPTFPLRWYHGLSNNHILYSFIAGLLDKIGIGFLWALRLPSLMASLAGSIMLYHFFYKKQGFENAIIFILVFNFLFPLNYYSAVGRGYAFHILFASWGLMAVYQIIIEGRTEPRYYVWLVISSVLGLYTAPSYLYMFLSYHMVIFLYYFHKVQVIKQIFLSGICVSLGVLFLYTPIILANGWHSLTNPHHHDFRIHSFSEILKNFMGMYQGYGKYYYGSQEWGWYIFLLVYVCMIYLGFSSRDKSIRKVVFIFGFIQLMPIFFLFSHRVFVATRIWSAMHIINVVACFTILKNIPIKSLRISLLAALLLQQVNYLIQYIHKENYQDADIAYTLTQSAKFSPQQEKDLYVIADKIRKPLEANEKIYFNYSAGIFYFSYFMMQNHYTFRGLVGFNLEGKIKESDYLIIASPLKKNFEPVTSKNFQETFTTQSFVVYRRRKTRSSPKN